MAKKVDLSKPEYEDLQQVAGNDIAKIVLNFCDSYCSKEIDEQWMELRKKYTKHEKILMMIMIVDIYHLTLEWMIFVVNIVI